VVGRVFFCMLRLNFVSRWMGMLFTSSEHNTYYVAPELNIQHNLNQQAHNTTNNTE